MTIPTLTQYLTEHGNDEYLDNNEDWKQFVIDHRMVIKQESKTYTLSPGLYNQCIYDMRRWLRTIGAVDSAYWIVQLINNIPSDIEFYEGSIPSIVYVPDLTTLKKYRQIFNNTRIQI